jgi:hypothetical protein
VPRRSNVEFDTRGFFVPKSAGGTQGSAVAFNILGVLGRAMLESLIVGNKDPATLADLAKRRLRS